MEAKLAIRAQDGVWILRTKVRLDRTETSRLYMNGDRLISWPSEGLASTDCLPVARSAMFLSELASHAEGFDLSFRSKEDAIQASRVVAWQLEHALEG